MIVVDIEMIDGNKVQEAVVFEKNEKGAKAIQNFNDLKSHFGEILRKSGMIHYNTRFMSGNIMINSIVNYEFKHVERDHYLPYRKEMKTDFNEGS